MMPVCKYFTPTGLHVVGFISYNHFAPTGLEYVVNDATKATPLFEDLEMIGSAVNFSAYL